MFPRGTVFARGHGLLCPRCRTGRKPKDRLKSKQRRLIQ